MKPFAILLSLFGAFVSNFGYGQVKYITFVKTITNDNDIQAVYDSLKTPLLLIRSSVYQINSDCIAASFGGIRHSGGASYSIDKSNPDASKPRNTGEASYSVDKSNPNASKPRNTGEASYSIDKTEAAKPRNTGEASYTVVPKTSKPEAGNKAFYCEYDAGREILILHIQKMTKEDNARIFYKNIFVDEKYYKIKSL